MAWGMASGLGQAGKDLWEGKAETLAGAKGSQGGGPRGVPWARLWWAGEGCPCSPLNVGSSSVVCPVRTFSQTTFCSVTAVIFSRSPVDKQHSLPEISYTDPAGRGGTCCH